EEGSLVSSGSVGFILADTKSMKAVFGVPDLVVRDLKVGQPLTIVVEAVPGARPAGRITGISPSANRTRRVFAVEVTIPNSDGKLRIGMIATVETPPGNTAQAAAIPAVPLTAVLKSPADPASYAVFIVSDDAGRSVAKIRNVKLGEVVGNRIAIGS